MADLYHARLKGGQTLTGFPWRFIYYGPYCSEAMQCIDQAVNDGLICKATYDSYFDEDKEFNIFICKDKEAEKIEELIHIGIVGQIQKAIRTLGNDTPQLLDHVYFNTEPMANARKGDLLDFSKAVRPESIKKVKLKKLSPNAIKLARQKIKQLSDEINADRKRLIKDEQETEKYKDNAYCQFIEMLDGEKLAIGLKGTAIIQITE
ncbi:MAG: hypothetical protein KKD92_03275 [Proteobacteria bacterium]|nr:hypothetical protein [Pseudomonadota bacterium]